MFDNNDMFSKWWLQYHNKSHKERMEYFDSLPKDKQKELQKSLFDSGWSDLFFQNYVDDLLLKFKIDFDLDIIDIRIKSIIHNRVFLIQKDIWDHITNEISYYKKYYNINILFGGLSISLWGKKKQFYRIKKQLK